MQDDDATQKAVEIALSQAKRVERELRILKQQLARLRDGEPLDRV